MIMQQALSGQAISIARAAEVRGGRIWSSALFNLLFEEIRSRALDEDEKNTSERDDDGNVRLSATTFLLLLI